MAALPYMPLFVADYLADTGHLTATQHGAYMLLLMNYWQRGGPLPDDDRRLASIARLGAREWKRNRPALEEFFTVTHGAWVHTRVDSELARVASKSLKAKKAAQASVERRFGERSAGVELTEADKSKETLAKANGASADSDQRFWANAKAFVAPEAKGDPGALIGKWNRDYGKEATAQAITRAQLERPVQRVPFIVGCLKQSAATETGWDVMP